MPETEYAADNSAIGIGTSRQRPDALAKLRGEYEFAPDLVEDGMLWGATLRSPHALARIKRIDLSPAKLLPGVEAVLGAYDVADNRYGVINRDTPVLADDYVRYEGEPVAIVAAVDRETAKSALDAIVVEYEPLSPMTDPIQALTDQKVYRHTSFTHGDPNVVGDIQVEGEYTTPRQDHSFLATDAGIARPDGRGGVEIFGATQWVQSDQAQVAAALALPEQMVRVCNSGIGGSFGGRFVLSWQIHGALLALHTERPVKFVYSRRETFLARYHRQPSRIWVRHHAKSDGTIVKLEARLLYECGPYSNTAGPAIGNGSSLIQGPYYIPNARVEGWSVATNNGMTGSLRGFGVVEPMFACESNMDRLAEALEMDPTELRKKNAMKEGQTWIFNQAQNAPTPVSELIEGVAATELPPEGSDAEQSGLPGGPGSPSRTEDISRGVALSAATKNVCLSEGAPVSTTALITLRDGVATIDCAAAEVGQGFVTVAIQVAQSALGISEVKITGSDTRLPPAATTDGQQQTMTSGAAVAVTAEQLKKRFLTFYAREHGLNVNELDISDDHVVNRAGERLDTVSDAGQGLVFRATETFTQRQTRPLDELDSPDPQHVAMNFSANRCVVDVDVELGLVKVVQMDILQDVGRAVNPAQVVGQIEGGSIMGMGLATMENMQAWNGQMVNTDWSTYQIPTTMDVPKVNVEFLENAEPDIPYGLRGIAELPHVQSPPAVAGAIRRAVGMPLPNLPAIPEEVCGVTNAPSTGNSAPRNRQANVGPWEVPKVLRDFGPWRADVPVAED
ncbi:MAG: molybdopterin-dependent oxidoreductase [Actinobacteria bacterium]|nr:molybdopterin-dependent oxidoreductase [Actinomycetota bacterium]